MASADTARVHVLIKGRVQGVFFRGSTRAMATTLGLTGYVRNLSGGDVEAVFEGDAGAVRKAVRWCREGPPGARVDSVDTRWGETSRQYSDFQIQP